MLLRPENLGKELPIEELFDLTDSYKNSVLLTYPIPPVAILLYLAIVWYGPHWMENKTAFQLKSVLRAYNFIQVLLNIYLLSGAIYYPEFYNIFKKIVCVYKYEDVEMLMDASLSRLLDAYFSYSSSFVLVKLVDLLDTLFIVLMKKNSQITFLHVYHHSCMAFFSWFTIKYVGTFQGIIPAAVNTVLHVILYSYYFLATFGPSVRKYLWWKRYLTKLQIVQFVAIVLYIYLLFYYDCRISKIFIYIWIFNVSVFLCLFINFYIKTYK